MPELSYNFDSKFGEAGSRFSKAIDDRELRFVTHSSYNAPSVSDESHEQAAFFLTTGWRTMFLIESEDAMASIDHSGGSVSIDAAGKSLESANALMEKAKRLVPHEPPPEDNDIFVTFWSMGSTGPSAIRRKLRDIPDWHDIYFNYTEETRDGMNRFMDADFRPPKGGQLMLWHGLPGTGKTTALRAMAREWRKWCEIHYIVDPEKFFGDYASYMMEVMVTQEQKGKWKLMVFEDTGEFLSADARTQMGNKQGLSRFLNIMDGLIGQGIDFVCLVTTNEELRKLHPAVTRPGRCMSINEFKPLTPEEITKWAEMNDVDRSTLNSPLTVADLYAVKTNTRPTEKKQQKVGFMA